MKTISFAVLMVLSASAWPTANDSYSGQEQREIKALSAEEQADLLDGKGMGLAKAAELNGYPGPRHVLELATRLELSTEQRAATQSLFAKMQTRARALGAEIVAAERSLDRLFVSRTLTQQQLEEQLAKIGALNAELRSAHLAAHLEQATLLSAAQIERYNALRGYSQQPDAPHSEHLHHGH